VAVLGCPWRWRTWLRDLAQRRSGVPRGRVRLGHGNLRSSPEPVYFGTGNPNPDYYGDDRLGDNLYTCSIVALDADTGKLRWHYQFTPHDLHDWDSNHVPVLADLPIGGQTRLDIPNDHLQYAITWFLIALAGAGVYLAYHWENGRLTVAGRTKVKA